MKALKSMMNRRLIASKNNGCEVIGKKARMKFDIADSGKGEWFLGVVSSYDGIQQKYGMYYPIRG